MSPSPILRMTQPRKAILEVLESTSSHPTADDIYSLVRVKLPRISLGTVYRNLEKLSASGRILKLELNGTPKRFDGRVAPHYHMRCRTCGRVVDLKLPPFRNLEERAGRDGDCLVTDHKLEFTGFCPQCRS